MAKLIGPLFSNHAHGKMAGLIYQTGNYGQTVHVHTPQRKHPSAKQVEQNFFFGVASDEWRVLSDHEKLEWDIRAEGMKMSGYNLYIKKNVSSIGLRR